MTILSLETSAAVASVALLRDGKVLAEAACDASKKHAETVLPAIDALLRGAGCAMAGLDAFAVDVGPGSFTGVRIGVATVKGLALGADKPCIGVSTLEAMAWGARALGGLICCVMDARAGQVYNALFAIEDGAPRRLCEDRAVKLSELGEEIGRTPYFLVGDGADLCYNSLKERCPGLCPAPPELRYATGYGVAAAALPLLRAGQTCTPQELDAFYLRRPQAERERLKRLSGTTAN